MSDENLLIFGCAVSFFALAGVYVYLRESFTRGRDASHRQLHAHDASDHQSHGRAPAKVAVEVRS